MTSLLFFYRWSFHQLLGTNEAEILTELKWITALISHVCIFILDDFLVDLRKVAFFTFVFFLGGPEIAAFIPRCMAGTLLLHVGLDLFLEGVVDSYGSYDRLEYGGIWLITLTMTGLGMTAGLIARVFAALSVYAAQSITYQNPIRKIVTATTLLSSVWTRPAAELAILNDEQTGRSRVLLVQLQGHLFFGNANQFTDSVKKLLSERHGTDLEPFIVSIEAAFFTW